MNLQRAQEVVSSEATAIKVIAGELIDLALEHKKKAALVVLFHIWVYGLALKHISELKDLLGLIPFFK